MVKGLKVATGTIVDATIINAPPSTKNAEKARDSEMHQTKKSNQWYFGMKAHFGVDSRTKSKVRSRVEDAIGVIKRVFGFAKVRYRGLKKNTHRLLATCALANLFMVRRHLWWV